MNISSVHIEHDVARGKLEITTIEDGESYYTVTNTADLINVEKTIESIARVYAGMGVHSITSATINY